MSFAVTILALSIGWIILRHFSPQVIQLLSMAGRRCQQLLHRRVDAFLAYCKANCPSCEARIFWLSRAFDAAGYMQLAVYGFELKDDLYLWLGEEANIYYDLKIDQVSIDNTPDLTRSFLFVHFLGSLSLCIWDSLYSAKWFYAKKYQTGSGVLHSAVLGVSILEFALFWLLSPFKYWESTYSALMLAVFPLLKQSWSGSKPLLTYEIASDSTWMLLLNISNLIRCIHLNYIVAGKFCKAFRDDTSSDDLRERSKRVADLRRSYMTHAVRQFHGYLQRRPYSAGITDDIPRESRTHHRTFKPGTLPPVSQNHPLFEDLKIDAQSSVLTEFPVPTQPSAPMQSPQSDPSKVSTQPHPSSSRTPGITDTHQSPRSRAPQVPDTPRSKLVDFYNQLFSDKENTDSVNPKSQVISKPRVSLDDLCAHAQQVLRADPELSGDALLDAIKNSIGNSDKGSPFIASSASHALDIAHAPSSSLDNVFQSKDVITCHSWSPESPKRELYPIPQDLPAKYPSPAKDASLFAPLDVHSVKNRSLYHLR